MEIAVLTVALALGIIYSRLYAVRQSISMALVTTLTTAFYFLWMPVVASIPGNETFLGGELRSLGGVYALATLYLVGALTGIMVAERSSTGRLALPTIAHGTSINVGSRPTAFWLCLGIAGAGTLLRIASGELGIGDTASPDPNATLPKFVSLTASLLIPLAVYEAIRSRFSRNALLFAAIVLALYLVIGFRFRTLILLGSLTTAFLFVYQIKLNTVFLSLSIIAGMVLLNGLGEIRRYNRGLDLSALQELSLEGLLVNPRGEIGVLFAADNAVTFSNNFELITYEPWTIAIARFVPSFVWPSKPLPYYLEYSLIGFDPVLSAHAGVAPPQAVEALFQFGWPGVLLLPMVYFYLASKFVQLMATRGRQTYLTAWAIAPFFFGYYMQSRGYFFQVASDGVAIFGPLWFFKSTHTLMRPNS